MSSNKHFFKTNSFTFFVFHNIYRTLLSSIGLILLLSLFGINNSTFATSSSLSLAIDSGNLSLAIAPTANGIFKESDVMTISTSTNNGTGYSLSIRANSSPNSTSLINDIDSNIYIPSISSAVSQSAFSSDAIYNNKWGYRPSSFNSVANTDYLPSPSIDGDILDITNAANTTANEYTISLGARVDSTLSPGSYSNTFIIEIVANATPYSVTYNANAGTELVSNMPTSISGETYDENVPIDPSIPTRDGYRFKGWCTIQTTNEDTCTGTSFNPDGGGTAMTWTIDQTAPTNTLNIYAMWEVITFDKAFAYAGESKYNDYYQMQNLTDEICTAVLKGQIGLLIDNRDNEIYNVGKLNDGKCWMLDNLRLGGSSPIPLTPSNTNIQTSWTLPIQSDNNFMNSYTKPLIYTDVKNDTATKYGQGSDKRGVYYNYCASTAETYCYPSGEGVDLPDTITDAPYDICPANWRLPTATVTGDYGLLLSAYNDNHLNIAAALGIVLSGFTQNTIWEGGDDILLNQESLVWTSTYCDASGACTSVFKQTNNQFDISSGIGRGDAVLPIRCVSKQSS